MDLRQPYKPTGRGRDSITKAPATLQTGGLQKLIRFRGSALAESCPKCVRHNAQAGPEFGVWPNPNRANRRQRGISPAVRARKTRWNLVKLAASTRLVSVAKSLSCRGKLEINCRTPNCGGRGQRAEQAVRPM